MNILQKGSRGDEVVKLQQMLRDAGFFNYPTNTGFFGDITDKALRDFQQAQGIKVDGVFGQRSQTALNGYKQLIDIQKNPNIPADVKKVLSPSNGDVRVQAEYAPGLTEEDYANIRTRAEQELEPFYKAQQAYETGDANSQIDSVTNNYNNQIQQYKQNAVDDANEQDTTEGIKGTWASSARKSRMNSLQQKYNSQFSSLYNTAKSNLSKLRSGLGYDYGDAAVTNNAPVSQISANLFNKNFTTSSTGGQYNPFGFEGRRNVEKKTNIINRANSLLGTTNMITK